MKLEIEGAPFIDRTSWMGKAIKISGAKTWCSLIFRASVALTFILLYLGGLANMIWGDPMHSHSPIQFIWTMYTILGTIVAGVASILAVVFGVQTFNCWAQNKCTPIFKDE